MNPQALPSPSSSAHNLLYCFLPPWFLPLSLLIPLHALPCYPDPPLSSSSHLSLRHTCPCSPSFLLSTHFSPFTPPALACNSPPNTPRLLPIFVSVPLLVPLIALVLFHGLVFILILRLGVPILFFTLHALLPAPFSLQLLELLLAVLPFLGPLSEAANYHRVVERKPSSCP